MDSLSSSLSATGKKNELHDLQKCGWGKKRGRRRFTDGKGERGPTWGEAKLPRASFPKRKTKKNVE